MIFKIFYSIHNMKFFILNHVSVYSPVAQSVTILCAAFIPVHLQSFFSFQIEILPMKHSSSILSYLQLAPAILRHGVLGGGEVLIVTFFFSPPHKMAHKLHRQWDYWFQLKGSMDCTKSV